MRESGVSGLLRWGVGLKDELVLLSRRLVKARRERGVLDWRKRRRESGEVERGADADGSRVARAAWEMRVMVSKRRRLGWAVGWKLRRRLGDWRVRKGFIMLDGLDVVPFL